MNIQLTLGATMNKSKQALQSHSGKPCVVCNAPYVLHITDVFCSGRGMEQLVSLYYCMACESAQAPNATPLANGGGAVGWHQRNLARNMSWASELMAILSTDSRKLRFMLDIGCGSVFLLHVAKKFGIDGVGFDTDTQATDFGRKRFEVHLRNEIWIPEATTSYNVNLITCISLLEHLHEPRNLIKYIVTSALQSKATIFVSVPLLTKNKWFSFWAQGAPPGPPVDVHVTHFSEKGLMAAFSQQGAKHFRKITAG